MKLARGADDRSGTEAVLLYTAEGTEAPTVDHQGGNAQRDSSRPPVCESEGLKPDGRRRRLAEVGIEAVLGL